MDGSTIEHEGFQRDRTIKFQLVINMMYTYIYIYTYIKINMMYIYIYIYAYAY